MKDRFITVMLILVLILGVSVFTYPFVSNMMRERQKDEILSEVDQKNEEMSKEQKKKEREAAEEYNRDLYQQVILTDPFDMESQTEEDERYHGLLNQNQDGIMAYVEIPRLKIREPVYHGTSAAVLEKGCGHLRNTSLPVGGKSTHAVISGHTGLADAEIFTNLTEMKKGDLFYIHVLGDILAYQVDQIKVVTPDQLEDLYIEPGKDYVTLVTCTPYGINSHRLLVRGERVPYTEEIKNKGVEQEREGIEKSNWRNTYDRAVLRGIGCVAILMLGVHVTGKIRKWRRAKCEEKR